MASQEDQEIKTYSDIYDDPQKFAVYIDSIVKSYNFCFTTDTNGIIFLKDENLGANDKKAEYMDGLPGLITELHNQIRYPSLSIRNGIEGIVLLKFMVKEDGTVCNITVYRQGGIGLPEEAIRVFSLLKNKWKPALVNNKKIASYTVLPITFKLQ